MITSIPRWNLLPPNFARELVSQNVTRFHIGPKWKKRVYMSRLCWTREGVRCPTRTIRKPPQARWPMCPMGCWPSSVVVLSTGEAFVPRIHFFSSPAERGLLLTSGSEYLSVDFYLVTPHSELWTSRIVVFWKLLRMIPFIASDEVYAS